MAYNDELVLKMFIQPGNDKLREFYTNAVTTHNAGIYSPFAKSGFDIVIPKTGTPQSLSLPEGGGLLPLFGAFLLE